MCGALSPGLGSQARHRDIEALCDRARQGQRSGHSKEVVTVCVKMPLGCVNVGALTRGEIEVRIEDRAKC